MKPFAALALLVALTSALAAATPEECQMLARHGKSDEAAACFTALTQSQLPYPRAEGFWGLGLYDEANSAFRDAVAQNDGNALYRVRWGLLLHQRFNNTDAVGLFDEALQRDPNCGPAFLAKSIVSDDGFDAKAVEYAGKALELDPKNADAHAWMARLQLEDDDSQSAGQEADAALAIAPDALDAMAVHAAIELVADRTPDEWIARMLAINPHYGPGYLLIARQLTYDRRYGDAETYFRKAIAADPRLWAAHSELGVNLMRLGRADEAAKELQLAYDNDYRNAPTVNSLRLLDSLKTNFTTFTDGNLVIKIQTSEAALLHPYVADLARKALASYEAKYQLQLPGPVQVEVYHTTDDFAVRALGLPGLDALGVTFVDPTSRVVAMDSPASQPPGAFSWGSVLWHELDHVFVLSMTNDRVPRWFAEGLAVHEEGQGDPEWANRLSPEVVAAIHDNKLLPIADLDHGFVRPQYPEQVVVSYYEAGRICDYIQSRWGDAGLLKMIHSFSVPADTATVIQSDLGIAPADFDKQFTAWLNQQIGPVAANFDQWRLGLKELALLDKSEQWDALARLGSHVQDLYPQYVDDANAYGFIAEADDHLGDTAGAVIELSAYVSQGGTDPALFQQLADDQIKLNQPAEAAATLDRVNLIDPVFNEKMHRQLGDLWLSLKNYPGAIREYGAVVAMNTIDPASAQYNLAQAWFASGDLGHAETAVLASLEAAPGYRPAQKLLLQIEDLKKGHS